MKFEIWNTGMETLEEAWREMDSDVKPTECGHIMFENDTEERIMMVNGGFKLKGIPTQEMKY